MSSSYPDMTTKRIILAKNLFVCLYNHVNEETYAHLQNISSAILIYIQQDATLHSLFYLETALHVSSGTITHHQERK